MIILFAFSAELGLLPTRFLQNNAIIYEISYVLLPKQYLLKRGGYTKMQYKYIMLYKRTSTGHSIR